MITRYKGNKSI